MLNSLTTASSLAKAFSQTADRRFNPDLVAVLKAVRNCFGHAVHPHRDAINSRIDHTLRQRVPGEANEAQSLDCGLSCLAIDGHPDHVGFRMQNPMKPESGLETNNAMGNTPAGDCDALSEIKGTGRGVIETTTEPGEKPRVHGPPHNLMVDSACL